ncbi:hypothetical protein [uncultured Roseivirga sp.]|uniref:hypothetical protein n=1 Tax=uncultured Roseivirga sp. TaxID=543088 RepID=UPI0030D70C1F
MIFKKQTISKLTSTGSGLSERAKALVNKDIKQLELNELAYLFRESIGTGICIPIAVKKLAEQDIEISMLHRNSKSENQRELIRELMLLDNWYWDRNSIAHKKLKEILGIKMDYLHLPTDIKEKFKNYETQNLIWNAKSVQGFNSYMNDSRMGVFAGYGMVTMLKRAILNGNFVIYEFNGKSTKIKSIEKFEELIVSKLNCNNELLELLDMEKEMKD